MKNNIINLVGWLLIAVCVALIIVHSYNTFIADNPPYNIAKGHVEVGVVGLLIWHVAKSCIQFKWKGAKHNG